MGTPTLTLRKKPVQRAHPNKHVVTETSSTVIHKKKLAVPPGFGAKNADGNWRTQGLSSNQPKHSHKTATFAARSRATEGERKDAGENHSNQKRSNKYKMELCNTWTETGSCPYGLRCQYAHGVEELREPESDKPSAYKTVRCRNFWEKGHCPYGKRCRFVHDEAVGFDEDKAKLVQRHPKYKTKICTTFSETGRCPYGDKCAFIHKKAEPVSEQHPSLFIPQTEEFLPTRITRTVSQTLQEDTFALHVAPHLPSSVSPKEMSVEAMATMALLSTDTGGVQIRRQSSGENLSELSRLNLWAKK